MIKLKLSKRLTAITLFLFLLSACASSRLQGTWEIMSPKGKVNLRISDDLIELSLNDAVVNETEIIEITDMLIKTSDGDVGYSFVDGKLKLDIFGEKYYFTRVK